MNLQQLAVFREVMKTGSVSQAARNLHRTQPAASASLKALEESLGMELFLREGRQMVPVPEAHYMLSEASAVLDRLKIAEQNLTSMRDRRKGVLRIVAMPGPSVYLLPEFISRFVADAPDVQVTLATRGSPQIRKLIAAQSFDIGFCDYSADQNDEGLFQSTSLECTCLCALPAEHHLANQNVIHAAELDNQPMGVLQPDHSTHRETKRAFAEAEAEFNVRFDSQYFLPLLRFVEAGQVCAVVDVLSAVSYMQSSAHPSRIIFRPFHPKVAYGYSILTPQLRPLSKLASDFVAQWRSWVAQTLDGFS
ncbi:MAG: LysR family transcriptional regulator [Rhodobacteraceae bacterium]|nr:LysR family transcriptional regulator [Paracoccaceae bacterium]